MHRVFRSKTTDAYLDLFKQQSDLKLYLDKYTKVYTIAIKPLIQTTIK